MQPSRWCIGYDQAANDARPRWIRADPPIWLRFMFPSVPGFGSRSRMMCVRAFGWLTDTHHAAMSASIAAWRAFKLA